MNPNAVALFRELADRSPDEREAYYVRERIPAAVRAEVESLLRFDAVTHSMTQMTHLGDRVVMMHRGV